MLLTKIIISLYCIKGDGGYKAQFQEYRSLHPGVFVMYSFDWFQCTSRFKIIQPSCCTPYPSRKLCVIINFTPKRWIRIFIKKHVLSDITNVYTIAAKLSRNRTNVTQWRKLQCFITAIQNVNFFWKSSFRTNYNLQAKLLIYLGDKNHFFLHKPLSFCYTLALLQFYYIITFYYSNIKVQTTNYKMFCKQR